MGKKETEDRKASPTAGPFLPKMFNQCRCKMKGPGLFPMVDFVIVFILEAQDLTAVKKNHDETVDRQQVMY